MTTTEFTAKPEANKIRVSIKTEEPRRCTIDTIVDMRTVIVRGKPGDADYIPPPLVRDDPEFRSIGECKIEHEHTIVNLLPGQSYNICCRLDTEDYRGEFQAFGKLPNGEPIMRWVTLEGKREIAKCRVSTLGDPIPKGEVVPLDTSATP